MFPMRKIYPPEHVSFNMIQSILSNNMRKLIQVLCNFDFAGDKASPKFC